MKKLAIAAAAAAALASGGAHAYTTGTFSNGFVVPNVIHNGGTDTTVVGVSTADTAVAVNWVFYDQDSVHKRDGCFNMTANDFEAFNWSAPKNGSLTLDVSALAGTRGYLVFAVGADASAGATGAVLNVGSNCTDYGAYLPSTTAIPNASAPLIGGAAFHVKSSTSDVAYVPVIDGPLTVADAAGVATNFASALNDPIVAVNGAAPGGTSTHYMRFFTEGTAATSIVIWNTGAIDATLSAGTATKAAYTKVAFPFDTAQNNYGSITLPLTKKELNILNAKTVVGATPTDGFIKWSPAASTTGGALASTAYNMYTYSVVDAPAFGALQSIVNLYK